MRLHHPHEEDGGEAALCLGALMASRAGETLGPPSSSGEVRRR